MKTKTIRIAAITLLFWGLAVTGQQCTENPAANAADETIKSLSDSIVLTLSEEEVHGILFMREEEKLARDVYLTLNETYPLRPFQNISRSEQAHMDAIKYLIDTYGLTDPVSEDIRGKFQNADLQELYDQLIEQGLQSKVEALRVGALIEEVDIIDLTNELDNIAENADVIRVYTNLRNASGNHLRAFVRVLGFNDVEYVPVKLDQDAYESIINNN